MKEVICKKVSEILKEISFERVMGLMEVPADEKNGDFAIPCFSLAKLWRKNPAIIAADLKEQLATVQDACGLLGMACPEQM